MRFTPVKLVPVFFAALVIHADAQTPLIWQGNVSGNLLLNTNWSAGVAPVAGDPLQFGAAGSAGTTLTLGSGLNTGRTTSPTQLPAVDFTASAPAYTFTGTGQLTIATGGLRNASGQLQTFNTPFRFNTGSGHTLSGANSALVFGGNTTLSAATSSFSMGTSAGQSISFNGSIVTGGSASANLTFNGGANASTVNLDGANNAGLIGNITIGQNVRVNVGQSTGLSGQAGSSLVTMNGANATLVNTSGSALTTAASLGLTAASQPYTFGAAGNTAANNITFSGTAAINADMTRTVTIAGSGVTISSASVWNNTVTGNRSLTVNGVGNTLGLGGLAIGASGESANVTLTTGGTGSINVSGGITNGSGTGTRSLQVNVGGTVAVNGSSNYSGTTGIGGGATYLVNGTHAGGSTYTVGGTLGGTGTIDVSSSNASVAFVFNSGNYGGKLQASSNDGLTIIGGTAAALNLTNAVAPTAAPSLLFTLGSPGGTLVDVQGLLNIGSGTFNFNDITFTTVAGFGGGTYRLFDYTTLTGSLGTALTGTVGGLEATISNDTVNTAIVLTVIPEPSTWAVIGLLGLIVATQIRRRLRAAS